jgi:hypothetical protein
MLEIKYQLNYFENRNFIQTYANNLKSRLILELQCILGIQNKRVMEIGESSLFAGIGLLRFCFLLTFSITMIDSHLI